MKQAVLALSGGVDSAVAGLLLEQQGFAVRPVHLITWTDTSLPGLGGQCPSRSDLSVARSVASQRKWDLCALNFEETYRTEVWDKLVQGYAEGMTPNPDVWCNQFVKFGSILPILDTLGGDVLATGHYAQIKNTETGFALHTAEYLTNADGVYHENEKDQSYFLSRINPSWLSKITFPLGHLPKDRVRELAGLAGLPNALRKDSQGVCFVGKTKFSAMLSAKVGVRQGDILDENGKVIGTHQGSFHFTIGQRTGISVAAPMPYYVARRNNKENTITVVQGHSHPFLYRTLLVATDPIMHDRTIKSGDRVAFRFRHRQPLEMGTMVTATNAGFSIRADKPQFAPAAGQVLALYAPEKTSARLLGSGFLAQETETGMLE